MNLPRRKNTDTQHLLFDPLHTIEKLGALRWYVGEVIEDLTAEVFGGDVLITNGTVSYCPDIQFTWGFAECKASGRNGNL